MYEKNNFQMTPEQARLRLQAIVSLAEVGDFTAAMAAANQVSDKAVAAEAWRLLGVSKANLQRWEEARFCIEIALQHAPRARPLRLQRALLLEKLGANAAALEELTALAGEDCDSPRLSAHLADALQFANRPEEAEAQLESGLRRWPTDAPLHSQLARLRWQRGAGADAMRALENAIEQFPRELPLRLVAADLQRNAGFTARALHLLEEGLKLAPDSAAFLTSIGALLTDLDRVDEALTYLRSARIRAPDSQAARRNLIPALLRSGAAMEVLGLCDELAARAPDDQLTIAWRATALRLLADPEYARLYDYPRLVRTYSLRPAAPFADIGEFNAAFAQTLTALHRSAQHPLAQSLRGGSQTERNLPPDNPLIAAFFAMLDAPLRDYLGALDGDSRQHPTDRRKRDGFRITGSWSVQLRPGGFHTNHVHPQGWLSSAYYVELPAGNAAGTRAGWIKFGEPGMTRPVCAPDHFVRPEPGMLVLFPSHMWHGTVPFDGGGRRLTAAFDVLPD